MFRARIRIWDYLGMSVAIPVKQKGCRVSEKLNGILRYIHEHFLHSMIRKRRKISPPTS